jgi:hypothetical protein
VEAFKKVHKTLVEEHFGEISHSSTLSSFQKSNELHGPHSPREHESLPPKQKLNYG